MQCFGKDRNRVFHCKVVLLDEQELILDLNSGWKGEQLLKNVFQHLDLTEGAYFGLRYVDQFKQPQWLDPEKKVVSQMKVCAPHVLYLAVKFYAADPCKLAEESTRYQIFLQVRQDILQGRLPVPRDLMPQLAALALQSQLGDFDPDRHRAGYVKDFRFFAHYSAELESEITRVHMSLRGIVPAQAELQFLDKVKWMDLYGVDLHPVVGEDSLDYFLGLSPTGILVLRSKTKVCHYVWSKILKFYIKEKYFMIRLAEKNNEEAIYGFETPSKESCRSLYKCCCQHLEFFHGTCTPPSSKLSYLNRRNLRKNPRIINCATQFTKPPLDGVQLAADNTYESSAANCEKGKVHDHKNSASETPNVRTCRSLNELKNGRRRSQQSNCSRTYSDNESEVSRVSRSSHGRHRRHRSRGDPSDSEWDSRSCKSNRTPGSTSKLLDEDTWKSGQLEFASLDLQSRDSMSEVSSSRQHRRRRRHRRRHHRHSSRLESSSRTTSRRTVPTEILPHLQFGLQDPPEGVSPDQLRQIPYQSISTDKLNNPSGLPDVLMKQTSALPTYIPTQQFMDSLTRQLSSLNLSSSSRATVPTSTQNPTRETKNQSPRRKVAAGDCVRFRCRP